MARNFDSGCGERDQPTATPCEGSGGGTSVPSDCHDEHDVAAQERFELVGWDEA